MVSSKCEGIAVKQFHEEQQDLELIIAFASGV